MREMKILASLLSVENDIQGNKKSGILRSRAKNILVYLFLGCFGNCKGRVLWPMSNVSVPDSKEEERELYF